MTLTPSQEEEIRKAWNAHNSVPCLDYDGFAWKSSLENDYFKENVLYFRIGYATAKGWSDQK